MSEVTSFQPIIDLNTSSYKNALAAIGDECWNRMKRGTFYVGSNCEVV
ncbi:MAG TPA: hypothetical protein GX523_16950 [Desulfitobacterium dehalogenans]|uniref:Uncharacterized protein n=1 Tax=Desulfitobacterium dehalogenans TaxID=36854 RepID=A0A7C7D7R6_9FIRM|nr:hypothetical protein [Desulfitobacterium dehalogenans]